MVKGLNPPADVENETISLCVWRTDYKSALAGAEAVVNSGKTPECLREKYF